MSRPTRVLGIDPGYNRLGLAIIDRSGGQDKLIHSECFETPPSLEFSKRLLSLVEHVENIIKKLEPDTLAIENIFISKNQKTAMKVSEVRGSLIHLAEKSGLKVAEFTPLQVKIAITGYGRSDKKQVEAMVSRLIKVKREVTSDDEIDAIAIALTGCASIR